MKIKRVVGTLAFAEVLVLGSCSIGSDLSLNIISTNGFWEFCRGNAFQINDEVRQYRKKPILKMN